MATNTNHNIEDLPGNDICRYRGRCSCGATFSTNSKGGYTNSTRAHIRQASKAALKSREGQAKKAQVVALLAPQAPENHILVVGLDGPDGRFVGYAAESGPLGWEDALSRWTEADKNLRYRKERNLPSRRRIGGVDYTINSYAVRSLADPRFAPLFGRGYADALDRETGRRSSYGDTGIIKAAKAWANTHGYKGAQGGWIYKVTEGHDTDRWRGQPIVQGWGSFAEICKRQDRIVKGADGLWYVWDHKVIVP